MKEQILLTAITQILTSAYYFILIILHNHKTIWERLLLNGVTLIIFLRIIEIYLIKKYFSNPFKHIYICFLGIYFMNITILNEININFDKLSNFSRVANSILIAQMFKQLKFYFDSFQINHNYLLCIPLTALLRLLIDIIIQQNYFQIEAFIILILIFSFQVEKITPKLSPNESKKIKMIGQSKFNEDSIDGNQEIRQVEVNKINIPKKQDFTSFISQRSSNSKRLIRKKTDQIQCENGLTKQMYRGLSILSQFDKLENNLNTFYQNLIDGFPSGILILNHKQNIIYMNNKCERLFNSQGTEEVLSTFQKSMKHAKFSEKDKKKGICIQLNKQLLSYQQLEDFIKQSMEQNKDFDIIDFLIHPQKLLWQSSPSCDLEKLSLYRQSSQISLTVDNFTPINFIYQSQSENRKRLLKLSVVQSSLTGHQSEILSQASINKINISSQDQNQPQFSQPILLILIKNITSKKQLEQVQIEYQFQNSLLKSFSHELRTPLNCSIQMLSLSQDLIGRDDSQKILENCIASALHSNQLLMYQINDILDFAAFECSQFQYKWQMIEIEEIPYEIQQIFETACNSKNITLIIKVDQQLQQYSIRTDKGRIMQVLVNLMNNAIKFTKEYGKIVIRLKLKVLEITQMIKISVKDNGIGLRREKLESLQINLKKQQQSSMFRSIKLQIEQNDIGLGLNISNKIISGLTKKPNSLIVKSLANQGTKVSFRIENQSLERKDSNISSANQSKKSGFFRMKQSEKIIPMTNDLGEQLEYDDIDDIELQLKVPQLNNVCFHNINKLKQETKIQQKSYSPTFNSLDLKQSICSQVCFNCTNVLIVDDIPFNHMALKALLEQNKVKSDSSYDGYQAIETVKQKMMTKNNHCLNYRLIFMDIEMPGMNGFQTASQVQQRYLPYFQINNIMKENKLETVIVMCSAYDTQENIKEGQLCGMNDFLPKPVRKKELERILSQYLCIQLFSK